jgi:hypothetical protein
MCNDVIGGIGEAGFEACSEVEFNSDTGRFKSVSSGAVRVPGQC